MRTVLSGGIHPLVVKVWSGISQTNTVPSWPDFTYQRESLLGGQPYCICLCLVVMLFCRAKNKYILLHGIKMICSLEYNGGNSISGNLFVSSLYKDEVLLPRSLRHC